MGLKARPKATKSKTSTAAKAPTGSSKSRWWSLTDRQRELALLMMTGRFSREEMAEKLGVGLKTVDSHRLTLLAGLGLQNAVQLVHYGVRNGLIKIPVKK